MVIFHSYVKLPEGKLGSEISCFMFSMLHERVFKPPIASYKISLKMKIMKVSSAQSVTSAVNSSDLVVLCEFATASL